MKFSIIFANSLDQEYALTYNVYNTPCSARWFESLIEQVSIDNTVAEPDRLYNFPNDNWTEEKIVNELNHCIEIINSTNTVIHHTAFVGMPQEQLNHLHHYFETLRGGILSSAEYWKTATDQEKVALERYNVIIHRAESFYSSSIYKQNYPRLVCRFNRSLRYDLLDEDYQHFTLLRNFGEVYINYCEVGKPLYDIYKDGDDIVGEDNIRPLRYYSAGFNTYFFNRSQHNVDKFLQGMSQWWDQNNNYLTALGFTKDDPKNAIGNIPVAMLETNKDQKEIIYNLCEYNKMKRVEVYE